MKKIIISSFFGLVVFFGGANYLFAACVGDAKTCALEGMAESNKVEGKQLLTQPTGTAESWLTSQVGNIIGNILAFVGVIFMALILYAGFLWMSAGGETAKTTKAIAIMTDAVVGLIVIGAAYILTQYVGNVVLGNI